jgi:hypothetical protein
LGVKVPRGALDLDAIDGFLGELLCPQALEVPMTDRAGEHIQQLDVSGRVIALAELVAEGTG